MMFRKTLRYLKEKEVCADAGFDIRDVRILVVFGHAFTPMMVHTQLAALFRSVIAFFAKHNVAYNVVYFGTIADYAHGETVQQLILDVGERAVELLDYFAYISVSTWTRMNNFVKMVSCQKGTLTNIREFSTVKDFFHDIYSNRDAFLCMRINELLPREYVTAMDEERGLNFQFPS